MRTSTFGIDEYNVDEVLDMAKSDSLMNKFYEYMVTLLL